MLAFQLFASMRPYVNFAIYPDLAFAVRRRRVIMHRELMTEQGSAGSFFTVLVVVLFHRKILEAGNPPLTYQRVKAAASA